MAMISHEDFKEQFADVIHKADLALRPYMLYVHPKNKEKIEQVLKEIGRDDFIIQETPFVNEDKIIVIEREKFEPKFDFGDISQWD